MLLVFLVAIAPRIHLNPCTFGYKMYLCGPLPLEREKVQLGSTDGWQAEDCNSKPDKIPYTGHCLLPEDISHANATL